MKFKKIAIFTLSVFMGSLLLSCDNTNKNALSKTNPNSIQSSVKSTNKVQSSTNKTNTSKVQSSVKSTTPAQSTTPVQSPVKSTTPTNLSTTTTTVTTTTTTLDNVVMFGSYPQTKIKDNTLIQSLNKKADTTPSETDIYNWTDYNYYIDGSVKSFMYYQDIDFDNNGTFDYRGVYFTKYRPNYHNGTSGYTNQFNNHYYTEEIYWFRYEPIKWNILSKTDDKALIISDLLLDSQEFYPRYSSSPFEHNGALGYANDYKLSEIRKFINNNFYNTAFNSTQKSSIEETTEENLNDNIFLLSKAEANSYYLTNSERTTTGTDYAKCQGLKVSTEQNYIGNSPWWLRTADTYDNAKAMSVREYGDILKSDRHTGLTDYGVRPACWIKL